MSQQELAEKLSCTQGNISFIEAGQPLSPERAEMLIAAAKEKGLLITFDVIYGSAPIPATQPEAA